MAKLYPAMVNSPVTELATAIDAAATSATLLNGAALPAAPNLATIGQDENAETVRYGAKSGNTISDLTRGFQGTARAWPVNTKVARNFTAYDYDTMRDMLEEGQTLPTPITRGSNVIQSDQASGATVEVRGVTLCNILGKDGGCESLEPFSFGGSVELSSTIKRSGTNSIKASTSSDSALIRKDYTYALDKTKTYLVGVWVYVESFVNGAFNFTIRDVGSNTTRYGGTINTNLIGQWQFVWFKIPPGNTLVGEGFRLMFGPTTTGTNVSYWDEIRLYEVSTPDSAAIGTTITGAAIDARWPYVDSVQPLRGVSLALQGKNLLKGLPDVVHANASVVQPYELLLNATGSGQFSMFNGFPVRPNQSYVLKFAENTGLVNLRFTNEAGTIIQDLNNNTSLQIPFTTPANAARLAITLTHSGTGTFRWKDWMLVLGGPDQLPASFEAYNPSYAHVPTELWSNVDRTIADSYDSATGKVFRRWATRTFDGSESWLYRNDNGTYITASLNIGTPSPYRKVLGDKNFYVTYGAEQVVPTIGAIANVSASYVDKPLATLHGSPDNAEGVVYITILKADMTTQDATGIKNYMAAQAAAGNPLTLAYVRATPVTEQLTGDLGGIDIVAGGNMVGLLEGVIVREKVTYVHPSASLGRVINGGSELAKLNRRAERILAVYKDGALDNNWIISQTGGGNIATFGNQLASTPADNYDPSAEYFVDYVVLDRYAYTANVIDATLSYRSSLGGAVAQAAQNISGLQKKVGVVEEYQIEDGAHIDNLRLDLDGLTAQQAGYGVTGGTAAAYTATLSKIPTLTAGLRVTVKLHVASAADPTINVNGLGARPIRRADGTAPFAGLLKNGGVYTLVYDGANFTLQGEGGDYGDATAGDVLAGKTIGTANGIVVGTMPDRGTVDQTITTQGGEYTIPAGKHSGSGKIKAEFAGLVPSNIRDGVTVGGVVGNLPPKLYATGYSAYTTGSSFVIDGLPFEPNRIAVSLFKPEIGWAYVRRFTYRTGYPEESRMRTSYRYTLGEETNFYDLSLTTITTPYITPTSDGFSFAGIPFETGSWTINWEVSRV